MTPLPSANKAAAQNCALSKKITIRAAAGGNFYLWEQSATSRQKTKEQSQFKQEPSKQRIAAVRNNNVPYHSGNCNCVDT